MRSTTPTSKYLPCGRGSDNQNRSTDCPRPLKGRGSDNKGSEGLRPPNGTSQSTDGPQSRWPITLVVLSTKENSQERSAYPPKRTPDTSVRGFGSTPPRLSEIYSALDSKPFLSVLVIKHTGRLMADPFFGALVINTPAVFGQTRFRCVRDKRTSCPCGQTITCNTSPRVSGWED